MGDLNLLRTPRPKVPVEIEDPNPCEPVYISSLEFINKHGMHALMPLPDEYVQKVLDNNDGAMVIVNWLFDKQKKILVPKRFCYSYHEHSFILATKVNWKPRGSYDR